MRLDPLRLLDQKSALETMAEEDAEIARVLDALSSDPPCEVCGSPTTSAGLDDGCPDCLARDVMIR